MEINETREFGVTESYLLNTHDLVFYNVGLDAR